MSKIDPEQLGEWLSAYIDGELSTGQTKLVERALQEDAGARRLLDELRRTVSLVSSLPRHPAPGSIAEDVRLRVERSELLGGLEQAGTAGGAQRSPVLALLSMAAVLALVVGGLWIMTRHEPRPTGPGEKTVALAPQRDTESTTPTRLDTEEKLIAMADFDQKLLAGMGVGAVRTHGFDNEPVRLQVTLRNEAERDATAARLVKHLTECRLVDLADVTSGDSEQAAPAGGFYYQGDPGVNFPGADQRQFLVRASRGELDGLIDELARTTTAKESVELVAGPLGIQGFERMRIALHGLGEPAPPAALGPNRATGDGLFKGLVDAMGLDPQMLSLLAEATPDTASEGPSVPTSVVDDADMQLAATDETQPGEASANAAGEGRGPDLQEPSPLVARRMKSLEDSRRRTVETARVPASADQAEPAPPREGGAAHVGPTFQSAEKQTSKPVPQVVVAERPAETYVTLVVQLIVAKPEPPRPANRARPSPKSQEKQRDTSRFAAE